MASKRTVWAYRGTGDQYVTFPSETKLYAAIRQMADAEQGSPGTYRTTAIETYQRLPGQENFLLYERVDLTTW